MAGLEGIHGNRPEGALQGDIPLEPCPGRTHIDGAIQGAFIAKGATPAVTYSTSGLSGATARLRK